MLQAENLLLFGPSGVAKNLLEIAITMLMIEQNQACRFFPATDIVQLLQKSNSEMWVRRLLVDTRPERSRYQDSYVEYGTCPEKAHLLKSSKLDISQEGRE